MALLSRINNRVRCVLCLLGMSLGALMLLGSLPAAASAKTLSPEEYQIKAVFLFQFAQFVEWPENTGPEGEEAFVIGVLGEDPFGTVLDETVKGERVNERPIEVRRFERIEDIGQCHLLFVSSSEEPGFAAVLSALDSLPILTIGDFPDFAKHGGMIGLVTQNKRIRFQVNLASTRKAGLTLSSNLLRSATIVARNGK